MTTPNILGSIQQGLGTRAQLEQLGAIRDNREQARLAAKQQELIGGLRRKSLGLGGATPEQQQEAKLELLSADPKGAKQFFESYSALPTPEQDRAKLQLQRITTAADNVQNLPDEQLNMGLLQTAQAFQNSGDIEAAKRTFALYQENLTPQQLRARLSAISAQTRDQEKVIASREKAALNEAKSTQKELDNELKASKDKFDMTSKLRKDVTAISKEFTKVRDASNRVEAVFQTNQDAINEFNQKMRSQNPESGDSIQDNVLAFGDMALIFNFMKMLDPGSTVREGEFASAQNTAGIPDRVLNLRDQLLAGTRLSTKQREAIKRQSEGLFKAAKTQNDKDLSKFRRSADKFDLDKAQIFDVEEKIKAGAVTVESLEGFNELTAEEQAELNALEKANVGG